jgi:hypothetical protein
MADTGVSVRTLALIEIEGQQETFSSIAEVCSNKCFPVMGQPGNLTSGELDCVDRCISKYLLTSSEIMQKMQGKTLSEQQAMEQQVQQTKGKGRLGGLLGGKGR